MQGRVEVGAEREEGINMSKDSISEEICWLVEGEDLTITDNSLQIYPVKIEQFTYLGSRKGRPLSFHIELGTEEYELTPRDEEDLEDQIRSLIDMESVQVDDSSFTLVFEGITWEV